jgi:hypothetical protein
MTLKKTINIEPFGCKLQIIITDVIKKEISKIYKSYGVDGSYDGEVEGVLITGTMGTYHLVIDVACLSHNTIAHETYHAVVRITEDRDVVDEETQAWLCGYITETLYHFIKLKKLEIK